MCSTIARARQVLCSRPDGQTSNGNAGGWTSSTARNTHYLKRQLNTAFRYRYIDCREGKTTLPNEGRILSSRPLRNTLPLRINLRHRILTQASPEIVLLEHNLRTSIILILEPVCRRHCPRQLHLFDINLHDIDALPAQGITGQCRTVNAH